MAIDQEKRDIIKDYLVLLVAMQEDIAVAQSADAQLSAKNIARINKIIAAVDDTGAAITKLGEQFSSMHHSHINQTLTHGFHIGGLLMSVFNFVRIPTLYLIAYLSNQPIPMTLGNNARWLHSSILFGLAIVALTVPPIAPVIAFVGAGLGLSVSVFLLGKKLYERYQLGREQKSNSAAIATADNAMAVLHAEAQTLAEVLKKVTSDEEFACASEHVAMLQEEYQKQKDLLLSMHQQQSFVKEQIKVLNSHYVFEKSLSVAFASASVIGLVISLFLPGLGLGIVAGVGVVAASYALVRIAVPLAVKLVQHLTHRPEACDEQDADTGVEYAPDSSANILQTLNAINTVVAPVTKQYPAHTHAMDVPVNSYKQQTLAFLSAKEVSPEDTSFSYH